MLLYQRPHPTMTSQSGAWKDEIDIIAYLAVMSNSAMISFTLTTFQNAGYSTVDTFWFFIMIQYITFALHYVRRILAERDNSVQIQISRSLFLEQKLIDKIPDFVSFIIYLKH